MPARLPRVILAAVNPANRDIRCDGCGVVATPEHLRLRVERLELATRFRPVHIDMLFLHAAPPKRLEDYFYTPAIPRDKRTASDRAFFDALTGAVGRDATSSTNESEETLLAEFQRAGCFLTGCCECALEDAAISEADLAERMAPAVLRRVQHSYRPKRIVLLSNELLPWVAVFRKAGLGERLVLHDGQPLEIPARGDSSAMARFRRALSSVLPKAQPRNDAGYNA